MVASAITIIDRKEFTLAGMLKKIDFAIYNKITKLHI